MATYSNPRAIPGVTSARTTTPRRVMAGGTGVYLPSSQIIGGTASRDATNTGDVDVLRAGKVMGKITSGGKWAPSILGVTTNAEANGSTTIEAAAGVVTELVRRVGATGTFKLTGPPTAAGTVRTLTFTYSAASSTNITVTSIAADEVQTLTFGAAATGGTLRLRVPLANGTFVTTDAITWNGTDATYLASINTALDAATGVTGGIVATGAAPDTALTFTFSGTGYAKLPQPTEMISVIVFPTSTTSATTVRTTTGVDGRFVAGSLIQPTDGSETPLSFIGDLDSCYGHKVTDQDGTAIDTQFHQIPVGGMVDSSQLIDWPSDTSLQAWLAGSLNAAGVGRFVFDHILTA